jgi:hypothetical protein
MFNVGHNMFILAEGFCNYTQPGGPPPSAPANETGGADAASKRDLEIDYNLAKRQSDNTTESPYGKCWDGSITNGGNPARRDVQMLPAYSYVVLQWNQDNPGAWPFHCHIVSHTYQSEKQEANRPSAGLALERRICMDGSRTATSHPARDADSFDHGTVSPPSRSDSVHVADNI